MHIWWVARKGLERQQYPKETTIPEGASPPPSFSRDTEIQRRGPSVGSLTVRSKTTGNQAEGLPSEVKGINNYLTFRKYLKAALFREVFKL